MRLLLRCAALCCALTAAPVRAAPFTVDDLLRVETRGETAISPDGRWLVIQYHLGQASAPRFDYDALHPYAVSRLRLVDLTRPGPATPLLAEEPGTGYAPGPFSPSGRRMLVHRLRDHLWESGIVDLATRQVRWLGVGVELPILGRTAVWRSETEIVAIVSPPQTPPFRLRMASDPMANRIAAWRKTTVEGGPSVTALGSGRYLDRGGAAKPRTLVKIDADSGRLQALATGEFLDLELSATSRLVAAVKEGADVQPGALEVVRGGTAVRRRNLILVDLDTGAVQTPCGDCDLSPHLLSWSPHGEQLLVYARQPGQAVEDGRLILIDAAARRGDATVKALDQVRPSLDYTNEGYEIIQAGWIGARPVVLGRPAQASPTTGPVWLDVGQGGATNPFAQMPATPDLLTADPQGRVIAIAAGRAWRLDASGAMNAGDPLPFAPLSSLALGEGSRGQVARLRPGDHLIGQSKGGLVDLTFDGQRPLGVSPKGLLLASTSGAAITAQRDSHGVQTLAVSREGVAVTVLTLNLQLASIDYGALRSVTHKGPGGQTLTSWVVLPPGWTKDHLPPLVVIPYPSRVGFSATSPPIDAQPGTGLTTVASQVLAGHGYAVLYPSILRNQVANEPSAGLADQILAAVDAVGAAGLADTSRIALWGHSFGGHAVLSAATQSNRFSAIICTSGVSDLFSIWGAFGGLRPEDGFSINAGSGYLETGQMRVGASPWQAPDRYVRNSPLLHADKITAPVLLGYGDRDVFSAAQGEEMFSALYRQGKDAKLLTFWGEGHVVLAPDNVRRLYAEALDWFDNAFAQDPPGQSSQPDRP